MVRSPKSKERRKNHDYFGCSWRIDDPGRPSGHYCGRDNRAGVNPVSSLPPVISGSALRSCSRKIGYEGMKGGFMPTATPIPIDVNGAVAVLTELQVLPVIVLSATIALATMLYHRFRR